MFSVMLFGLLAGASSPAQQSPHGAHSDTGPVPLEILQLPVTLRTGIGELHEKVSTRSPESQSFYDHGLAYLLPTFGLKQRVPSTKHCVWTQT